MLRCLLASSTRVLYPHKAYLLRLNAPNKPESIAINANNFNSTRLNEARYLTGEPRGWPGTYLEV